MNILEGTISLAHGNGGKHTQQLVASLFLPAFNNPELTALADSACLPLHPADSRFVFTTDSHVITPLFFPGGDIGTLAVSGTVNDLAVMGARPLYLSAAFIIEEGFAISDLSKIVKSMARTAAEAGVKIVTGDTKVVEKGAADKLFISTAGIGTLLENSPHHKNIGLQEGDAVIVSGSMGDHGMAIYTQRSGIDFKSDLCSDCAVIFPLVENVLKVCSEVKIMRDPTRGGLATTLNEFVRGQNFGIQLFESAIPLKKQVQGACELLGFDPLYLANEGKLVIVAPETFVPAILGALQSHPLGQQAACVGKVTQKFAGKVCLQTSLGGQRILDILSGDMLPRIC